jgi:hypothetical protein
MGSEESDPNRELSFNTDLHSISGNTKRSSVVTPVFWNPNINKNSELHISGTERLHHNRKLNINADAFRSPFVGRS